MIEEKIKDYIDLKVWQKALKVINKMVELVDMLPPGPTSKIIAEQIIGSSSSVCGNIAEGHSSGSSREFNRILKIAYREAKETDNWLQVIKHTKKFAKPEIIRFTDEIEKDNLEVIKMLYSLRKSIQNLIA